MHILKARNTMVVFWEFTFTIYFVNFGILNVINKEHNVELLKNISSEKFVSIEEVA